MGMTNRSTLRRPVTPESSVFCSTEVREREELEEIVTDQLLLRHPRALLMLSCVQMCLGVKISVFGLICRVYDGCPLATPVWGGCVLSATGLLGLVFVKVWSRRQVLLILIIASVLSVIVSFGLFVQTTLALEAEESRLKGRWNYIQQSYVDINRIVENTKIAMWALELVLTPIEGKFRSRSLSKYLFWCESTLFQSFALWPP